MEMVHIRTRMDMNRCAGTGHVKTTAIADMWSSSLEAIAGCAKMPLFKGWTIQMTPPLEFLRARPFSTTI